MGAEHRYTSADLMRKQNARSILKTIHDESGIYRKNVAIQTNLAAQTVTNIISVLIEKGIVLEQPLNTAGKGRNPFALQINYGGFYIVSVQVTNFFIEVYLNSLDSKVLYQRYYEVENAEEAFGILQNGIGEVFRIFKDTYVISAIVISECGIVDEKKGIVIEDYVLNWQDLNLRKELKEFEAPVLVLNDVNIIAHYENTLQKDKSNFMIVKIENGVGSALVLDGKVIYSSNRVSGEFGHVTAYVPGEKIKCFCGRTNCLTKFISKGSLKSRLQKSYDEIKEEVRKDGTKARQMVENIGPLMAPKLSDLIVLLDLDRVLLIGDVVEDFEDIILPSLREEIQENMSFWVPFHRLEVKKYDCFPKICSSYAIEYYFSGNSETEIETPFLWDAYIQE